MFSESFSFFMLGIQCQRRIRLKLGDLKIMICSCISLQGRFNRINFYSCCGDIVVFKNFSTSAFSTCTRALHYSSIIHEDNHQPELSICTTCRTLKPCRILSARVQIHFADHALPREQSHVVLNIPSFFNNGRLITVQNSK